MKIPKIEFVVIAAAMAAGLTAVAIPSAQATTTAAHTTATAAAPAGAVLAVNTQVRPDGEIRAKICAYTNKAYCADIVGDSNTSGTKIWLYKNGGDDTWILAPYQCNNGSGTCWYFEDAKNIKLCMTAIANAGAETELKPCTFGGGWYDEGSYQIGNDSYGATGELDVQSVGQHSYLLADNPADGAKYIQWWIPGFN